MQAEVKKVNAKEIRKWRPLPLQTVEFQKLASQKLRIDSSVAMDIAEKLCVVFKSESVSFCSGDSTVILRRLRHVQISTRTSELSSYRN